MSWEGDEGRRGREVREGEEGRGGRGTRRNGMEEVFILDGGKHMKVDST